MRSAKPASLLQVLRGKTCSTGNSWPAAAATAGRCQTTHRCSGPAAGGTVPGGVARGVSPCAFDPGGGGRLPCTRMVGLLGWASIWSGCPPAEGSLLASFPGRAVSLANPGGLARPRLPSGCGRASGAQSCLRPSFADACTENQPCLLLPRRAGLPLSPPRAFPAPPESGPNMAGCDQNHLLLNKMENLQFQVHYDRCPNLLHV